MTARRRDRATSPVQAAKIVVAGAAIGLGAFALGLAGPAGAEPLVPTPVPGDPAAPPPPGQPVPVPPGELVVAAPAPPPMGEPMVPEITDPKYGSGSSSGPLGFLKDAWNQAKNPYGDAMPVQSAPPPGAGPAPQLPPGYVSTNAPGSNGPPAMGDYSGGPPLPEGYHSLNGPPPPGYFDGPPPPPPPDPNAYVPVVSPPPPPLLPPR